jgi:hypothetical protein
MPCSRKPIGERARHRGTRAIFTRHEGMGEDECEPPYCDEGADAMTKYLISFPSAAMNFSDEDLQAASDASRAVVQEAKEAGVWVFGGGIDEGIAPVVVDSDGTVREGTYPQTTQLDGGYSVLELPSYDAALEWAAKMAAACRCAQEVRAFHYDPAS